MRRVLSVVLGAFLMAAALVIFLSPASLVTGGASGVAVIVKALSLRFLPFAIPLWFTNLAVNIPLIVLARARLGRSFVIKTLIGTLLLSFFLNIVQNIMQYIPSLLQEDDDFINAVFGGAVMGLGMGLVLSGGATTGGSDLLAAILREKIRGVGIAALIFIIDLAVIICGMFVFGVQKAMYSIVAVYVSTKAANLVLEGLNFARVAFIMTDKAYKTAECLMRRLHRGATLLNGEGAYTGSAKNVVMIVISKRQAAEVKEIVSSVDPHAFMFVADVREVMGEFS
ncbi:MAG: YitT family protein [Firmicutes bacterium]|nr:YitT family protein [Bacillota bacterium]